MHLRNKGNTYHWRRKIPCHLAHRFGKVDIVRSLRTSNYEVAIRRARRLSTAIDGVFELTDSQPELTQSEIEEIVRREVQEWNDEAEETRATRGKAFSLTGSIEDEEHAISWCLSEHGDYLIENKLNAASRVADRILAENEIKLDRDSVTYKRFCRTVLRGQIDYYETQLDRVRGLYPSLISDSPNSSPNRIAPKKRASQFSEIRIQETAVVFSRPRLPGASGSLAEPG